MKKVYDAVVVTGKYTGSDGKEKNRYLTVGAVLENEHGHLSLKLEAIPVVGFSGWINFYRPKEKTEGQAAGKSGDKPAAKEDFDDKIPFAFSFCTPLGSVLAGLTFAASMVAQYAA